MPCHNALLVVIYKSDHYRGSLISGVDLYYVQGVHLGLSEVAFI